MEITLNVVRQNRSKRIWKRVEKNWFQLIIGLIGLIHGWYIITKQVNLNEGGGSFTIWITAIALIKTALKDDDKPE